MMLDPFATVRKEYQERELNERELAPDPFAQFKIWYDEAVATQVIEPNAMTLATAAADGSPSARTVLLKGFDAEGFLFFTNYESQKGRELAANPHAALVFYWGAFERQVRLTGATTQTSRAESEKYFRSRPVGAQLGAWASAQSEVIENRAVLEKRLTELTAQYANKEIPMPPYWGGYRLMPSTFEFWQGRLNRLHDRFRYTRHEASWRIERLAP